MNQRWDRIRSIFEACVELEGDELEACLRKECGEDSELLAEVRSLLHAHQKAVIHRDIKPGNRPSMLTVLPFDGGVSAQ